MEYLDIVDNKGIPTGQVVERELAHAEGIMHRTAHVWVYRLRGGQLQLLLQKRCDTKDSFPGCYDISSAGHIPAGVEYVESALRELEEELGVTADAGELEFVGDIHMSWDDQFHGKEYHDRQYSRVFAVNRDMDESQFALQETEVSSVMWIGMDELLAAVDAGTINHCLYPVELEMVREHFVAE